MKCIALIVLVFAAALDAYPYPYPYPHPYPLFGLQNIGTEIVKGISNGVGDLMGLSKQGKAAITDTAVGIAKGLSSFGIGLAEERHDDGVNGEAVQAAQSAEVSEHHDIGEEHNSVTTITKTEHSEVHDVGASEVLNQGELREAGLKKLESDASKLGSELKEGLKAGERVASEVV